MAETDAGTVRLGRCTQQGYLSAGQYLRLKGRRGSKEAIVAVAASILTAAYHVLKCGVEYRDWVEPISESVTPKSLLSAWPNACGSQGMTSVS
jgi:hypothetical protein